MNYAPMLPLCPPEPPWELDFDHATLDDLRDALGAADDVGDWYLVEQLRQTINCRFPEDDLDDL